LGFLAGSHMRSAFELKQNVIGIGMLWKYGYYDQTRKTDNAMDVQFREKNIQFSGRYRDRVYDRSASHPGLGKGLLS
jgi:glucan phosphorylase